MKRVTVELSDDGKRLWVMACDPHGDPVLIDIPKMPKLRPGEKSGNVGDSCWPALSVGLAIQRALMGKDGNS